jgi:RimJ/RimL family protein N-acetyltransferase
MRSDEEASVAAAKATQQHSFHEVGDYLVLGIELKSDGVFIGQLNAMFRSVDMAEFGYVLNSSAQGHGYATEAAEALIEALWTEYPFVRIEAHLDSRNLASRGVAERLGLRHEPEHDLVTQFKGEEALSLTFALTRPGESQEK